MRLRVKERWSLSDSGFGAFGTFMVKGFGTFVLVCKGLDKGVSWDFGLGFRAFAFAFAGCYGVHRASGFNLACVGSFHVKGWDLIKLPLERSRLLFGSFLGL